MGLTQSPYIPDPEFLERRSTQFVERERRRQDQLHGGWEHDREHSLFDWLAIIDQKRGELGGIILEGGRYQGYDRRAAIKLMVQISAVARRAVTVLQAEAYEPVGEHLDDQLHELFQLRATENAAAEPRSREEGPF